MDSQQTSLSAEALRERLNRYKQITGEQQIVIAGRMGKTAQTINYYCGSDKSGGGIGIRDQAGVSLFCEAFKVSPAVLLGDLDTFSEAVRSGLARWRNVLASSAHRAMPSHALSLKSDTARLVQPIARKGGGDYEEITIGSRRRIAIDVITLLASLDIEIEVDDDPLAGLFLYVLQIERTGCVLLRPNSHFSLSDSPADNEDIRPITIPDHPHQGMHGMLYIPATAPGTMVFAGEPGRTHIAVLIANWPAIPHWVMSKLSHPDGADPRELDRLAAVLMPTADQRDQRRNGYWRIFSETFELVRWAGTPPD